MVTPPPRLRDLPLALLRRFPGQCALIIAVLLMVGVLCAEDGADVPRGLLAAMLHEETSSHYRADGSIRYVNQKRGRAGELGAWQAKPSTLRLYRWSPSLYEVDPAYAEQATRSILAHYFNLTGSWSAAAASWRGGLKGRTQPYAVDYARRVAGLSN